MTMGRGSWMDFLLGWVLLLYLNDAEIFFSE
jgi:hypothetical protein